MNNNKNDVVIIELDRPRELRYGYKALKTMVAMIGKDFEEIVDADTFNLRDTEDFESIEKIICCGLLSDARKHGEELKLEQIEDLLDLQPMSYILEKMTEAFTAAFGGFGDVEEIEKNSQRIAQDKKKK
jgi:hypothetical protein